jgi:hypothetical protein
MNCDGVKELLAEGQPLTESAQRHLASCAGCSAMMQALIAPAAEPDPKHIREIQGLITTALKPVRPLPSTAKLVWSLLAVFAAFSLLAAVPVGYKGFHVLNLYERFLYYGSILACAAWFSITIAQAMIPGSKHKISPRWLILTTTLALAFLVSALFQEFDTHRFVMAGLPCLRLGCICALLSGALFWVVLRRGFFTSPVAATTTVGCFAGLAGVAVLSLHCPIENSAHIIVWHLGAMALGGLGGAAISTLRR